MGAVSSIDAQQVPQGATRFVSLDPEFLDVLGEGPRLEHVVAADAHEGPVYVPDEDALYFTSLPRQIDASGSPVVAIQRVDLDGDRFPVGADRISVVPAEANVANGMALDLDGSLVICQQGTMASDAAIGRLHRTNGELETVVDRWRGLRFNSPNDIVVRSDSTLWFTDPSYGFLQGFKPEPETGDHVYRYDPVADRVTVVADAFDKPNGLAFSPDERTLYITDSGANQEAGSFYAGRPHHVMAFDVLDERHLSAGRLFAVITPGVPDGIKVDDAGCVYVSGASGVQVFSPAGDLIGEISLPGAVNFAFGGLDRNVLFITTDTDIWAAVVQATGGPRQRTSMSEAVGPSTGRERDRHGSDSHPQGHR